MSKYFITGYDKDGALKVELELDDFYKTNTLFETLTKTDLLNINSIVLSKETVITDIVGLRSFFKIDSGAI